MKVQDVTSLYFSEVKKKEFAWRWVWWTAGLVLAALLYLFWEPLRSPDFVKSFASLQETAFLASFFKVFNFLGDEKFFMVFISLIFWCFHKSLGYWTSVLLLLTASSSDSLKELTALPRPETEGARQATDFSFPNGPPALCVAVWGYLSVRLRNKGIILLAGVIIFLVALSEIVLGMGYLGDVMGGLLLGFLALTIFAWANSLFVERGWAAKFAFPVLLVLAVAIPVALIFVWTWDGAPKLMGYLAGGSLGYVLEREKLRFKTGGRWYQQLLKAVIGLAGLFGIVFGLEGILPGDVPVTMFAHFALIGLWVTFIAPSIFILLRLTSRDTGGKQA